MLSNVRVTLLQCLALAVLPLVVLCEDAQTSLPIVNLGYTRHQAIAYDKKSAYYNFSSIRYAQPPVGDLRFALPVPPIGHSDKVTNGREGRRCPQSLACWYNVQAIFFKANTTGQPFNFDEAYNEIYGNNACNTPSPRTAASDLESEDCLFLDVIVPKRVYDAAGPDAKGAPVLVYFQDGGFVSGWKEQYSPAGLIRESLKDGSPGMIYVGFNNRLGAFGWLYGSSYEEEGGIVNAALHDQRLLLNWIQRNIKLFGGDPSRVTIMGESAGGSGIVTQLTAYRNNEAPPFKQIAVQSPAGEPASKTPLNKEQTYQKFLSLLGVSSLAEARKKSSRELLEANDVLVKSQPYGASAIGPANDGTLVPIDWKISIAKFVNNYNITSLTQYSSNEGGLVTPANITTEADFRDFIDLLLAGADQNIREYVQNDVYPPVYDGSYNYTTLFERAKFFWGDMVTSCNSNIIHSATKIGWSTEYMVAPAIHLSDTATVFWNGPGSDPTVNEGVAAILQGHLVNYIMRGDPNKGTKNQRLPTVPRWGTGKVLGMNTTGPVIKDDSTINSRCEYMRTAPWTFS